MPSAAPRPRKFAPGGRGRSVAASSSVDGWIRISRRRRKSGKFAVASPDLVVLGSAPDGELGGLPSPSPAASAAASSPAAATAGSLVASCNLDLDFSAVAIGPRDVPSGGLDGPCGLPLPSGPASPPPLSSVADFPPLVPSGPVGPIVRVPAPQPSLAHVASRAQVGTARTGYLWIPRGSSSPLLGFPASASDLRRHRLPIRRLIRSSPPPPLLLPFAVVLSMDKSRGSSCEALSGSKRRREDSPSSAVDLELEASLRSKLEAEQAARAGGS